MTRITCRKCGFAGFLCTMKGNEVIMSCSVCGLIHVVGEEE